MFQSFMEQLVKSRHTYQHVHTKSLFSGTEIRSYNYSILVNNEGLILRIPGKVHQESSAINPVTAASRSDTVRNTGSHQNHIVPNFS